MLKACFVRPAGVIAMKKNPHSVRAPAGLEWKLVRKLPTLCLAGLLALLLAWGLALVLPWDGDPQQVARNLRTFNYTLIGLAIFHLTMIFTLALGCLIVMIMKGPQYTSDSYPVLDAERPAR